MDRSPHQRRVCYASVDHLTRAIYDLGSDGHATASPPVRIRDPYHPEFAIQLGDSPVAAMLRRYSGDDLSVQRATLIHLDITHRCSSVARPQLAPGPGGSSVVRHGPDAMVEVSLHITHRLRILDAYRAYDRYLRAVLCCCMCNFSNLLSDRPVPR